MLKCEKTIGEPVKLHPENKRYFYYNGKPMVLITSGEDYGSILNLDFNYSIYLDELKSHRLNHARVFSGVYREIPGVSFNVEGNAIAPLKGRYICPWARSSKPGADDGGNLYDLDVWNEEYFKRLKDFMRQAQDKGIIVEFVLFCTFYFNYFGNDLWQICPLNNRNNINGTEEVEAHEVYKLRNKRLMEYQEKMVSKLVHELNEFDNLFYEVLNEPWNDNIDMEWQQHIVKLIVSEEAMLPKKHLISMDVACGFEKIKEPYENVSIYNFHYASSSTAIENQHLNKVIGYNETGFCGQDDYIYRTQAWEFMLSGGALFNNIDYSFSPGFEDGTFKYGPNQPGGGSKQLRKQLGILKTFLDSLDFIHMTPDNSPVIKLYANCPSLYMMHDDGNQYAGYIRAYGIISISLDVPAGIYTVEWIDPVSGSILKSEERFSDDGVLNLEAPNGMYNELAFKVLRKQQKEAL
ncbi:hypothetical protein CDQ84_03105 [Clostridium thermosuccinogenes]|uniref:DUF6298 domain-containing protein n=1 Tax=Clostridium thermosuccinogenes TaxID=84032 RepID=A0A2K2FKY9_9CLOT|nr:DUF6298 domain-containing protein [Pseudoclostridium thermosuccinogenes]AUS96051.1 hypothetical protein CDO33_06130 [Pseudoclostridium thermosuccinogenes]PNT99439.1 hypothetical protein CDQ85_03105 [Pseudoclostridium thermosuccinogenes]PNU01126.1 hypothetical protein CDQ84_03105 [Pseudoclostridium thermosuccinogenes]